MTSCTEGLTCYIVLCIASYFGMPGIQVLGKYITRLQSGIHFLKRIRHLVLVIYACMQEWKQNKVVSASHFCLWPELILQEKIPTLYSYNDIEY